MEEIQKVDTIVVNGVDIPLGGQGGGGKILHKWKVDTATNGIDFSEDENNFADVIEDKANILNHDILIDLTPAGMSGFYSAVFTQCTEEGSSIGIYYLLAMQAQIVVVLNQDGSVARVQM